MLKQDVLLFLTILSNVPGYNSPRSHPQMFKGQRLVLNPDGWYVPMILDLSWQNPFFLPQTQTSRISLIFLTQHPRFFFTKIVTLIEAASLHHDQAGRTMYNTYPKCRRKCPLWMIRSPCLLKIHSSLLKLVVSRLSSEVTVQRFKDKAVDIKLTNGSEKTKA